VLFLALDVNLGAPQGDAIHVRELARSLVARGHAVDVVGLLRSGADQDLPPGVRHHASPGRPDLRLVRFCSQIARETQCDIIYERRLSPKIAFAVARLASVPFVVEVNGIPEEAALIRAPRPSPLRPVKSRVRKQMFRAAARVVAVSDRLALRIREEYELAPDRVVTIPNGVDVERFHPMDRAMARREFPPLEGPWILFVGNLVPWQGVDVLIRAVPAVLKAIPESRILIAGDGVSRQGLERFASDLGVTSTVVFRGAVPHHLVPTYIGASDVCVAPFTRRRNEVVGLSPLKVNEYLACGRPVVVSDLPGMEFIRDRRLGLVVPPDDPKALAAALSRLLADPTEARLMGKRGREFVLQERSWDRTAERVEGVLRTAVEDRRGI